MRIVCEQASEKSVVDSLVSLIEGSIVCSIATVTANNHAYISDVYFSYTPGLDFYFISDPAAVHCRNIAGNPAAALSVHKAQPEWGNPEHGVQLFGHCHEATGEARKAAEASYIERFPRYSSSIGADSGSGGIVSNLASYRFFHFVPDNVKLLDEKRFGGAVLISAVIQHDR